ncbi:30S ribosomal protein S5 [Mycoplasma phocoeninasale]|uniref:Small ribosomal subunit protein uS5 n=1 Tax=Mycoplasma phocoeninasale TaxID=2726117 RepID=A0A858U448_9MOLU|nr:30S ribosomal protein S5 [Mycoplasma phocoeninasale]QJG66167.1 30S ribosomal protein S5 [Mycoplasma phocoeninasale]
MTEETKKTMENNTTSTKVIAPVNKGTKSPLLAEKRANHSDKKPKQFSDRKAVVQQPKLYEEKVIDIARVTTVVKGGRRFSFSAYVVVGDKKGKVGFGHGKANEVQDAIKKAVKDAQKHIFSVPIVEGTIPHEISEKFLASKIQLRPAPKGAGIIASNTVRAVVELAGYTDISTKTYGSRTKQNIVQAAIKALKKVRTVEDIAKLRDIDVKYLLSK